MLYSILVLLLLAVLGILLMPLLRRRESQTLALWLAAFLAIAAFGLYGLLGSPRIIPALEAREARLAELRESIARNSARVQANPKELEAWVLLGVDFMETAEYEAASHAFKQAVLLSGGEPELILAYAKAQVAAADGKVSDLAKKSFEMVLLQEPGNADAKYFLILRKLQDGKTEDAMGEMKALYRSLPENSPLKNLIDRQIGKKPPN